MRLTLITCVLSYSRSLEPRQWVTTTPCEAEGRAYDERLYIFKMYHCIPWRGASPPKETLPRNGAMDSDRLAKLSSILTTSKNARYLITVVALVLKLTYPLPQADVFTDARRAGILRVISTITLLL